VIAMANAAATSHRAPAIPSLSIASSHRSITSQPREEVVYAVYSVYGVD
jgi:hypothetical protein